MADEKSTSKELVSRFWSKIGLMAEIADVFRKNPPERATYKTVLEIVQKVVLFDRATLYFYDSSRKCFKEECAYGTNRVSLKINQLPTNNDFIHLLIRHKKPLYSSDLQRIYKVVETVEYPFLVIPLLVENDFIGMVIFVGGREDSFIEKDVKLLTIICDQIAISIERSIYQKELENKNLALKRAHLELEEIHKKIVSEERLAAVKNLAVSINHEINNPLSVITGNSEYILYSFKDLDPKIAERLKIIESEALKISQINHRLLDIQYLVTEPYLKDDSKVLMINLQKSSSGVSDG